MRLGIAIVLDEYGSFEGMITAADVLEAIVGDADDPAPKDGTPQADQTEFEFDGLMPVDDTKARLHLPDLPNSGSYHTLGGLILALAAPAAAQRRYHHFRRLEICGAGDGRPPGRSGAGSKGQRGLAPAGLSAVWARVSQARVSQAWVSVGCVGTRLAFGQHREIEAVTDPPAGGRADQIVLILTHIE